MTFYKTKYSSGSNDVALLYKRQLSCVLIFYSELELLDNSQEINILWGNFNFDILDSEIFERITNTLSNFYYLLLLTVHIWIDLLKNFLDKHFMDSSDINAYRSDGDAVQVEFNRK